MPATTANPIKASTQEHLDIFDVQDDIVIMKDGSCALIMQITAINFGLLSEGEQDAIIFAYAGLLNSLTFQIQIIIQSNIKDITDYIRLVKSQENKQKKDLLKKQLIKYREFVEATVRDNHVLDKKFYVSIPFTSYELGLTTSVVSSSFILGTKSKSQKLPYPMSHILERAKFNLYPKRDHLVRQFARIGLKTRQLNTQQLLELFYTLYNRESMGQKFVDSADYSVPFVNPALGRTNVVRPPTPFTGGGELPKLPLDPGTPPPSIPAPVAHQVQSQPTTPPPNLNLGTNAPHATTPPLSPPQPSRSAPLASMAPTPQTQTIFPKPVAVQPPQLSTKPVSADQAFGYASQ